jgi:hypothetical protein
MKQNTKQKKTTSSISEHRNRTSLRERPRNGRTRNPQNSITDLDYGKNPIINPQPEPSSTVQKQQTDTNTTQTPPRTRRRNRQKVAWIEGRWSREQKGENRTTPKEWKGGAEERPRRTTATVPTSEQEGLDFEGKQWAAKL